MKQLLHGSERTRAGIHVVMSCDELCREFVMTTLELDNHSPISLYEAYPPPSTKYKYIMSCTSPLYV